MAAFRLLTNIAELECLITQLLFCDVYLISMCKLCESEPIPAVGSMTHID